MDQELIAYFDERFRETSQQIAGLHAEMNQRFEQVDRRFEQVDLRFEEVDRRFEEAAETARHAVILIEGLRHEVQLIAEAYMGLDEKLVAYQSGIDIKYAQVQASIEPYYRDLNTRVKIIEERADRQHEDVMDSVRKAVLKYRQAQEGG